MFGTLEKKDIEEVLRKQIIGRIGCHAEGLTYVVPISYAYDGDCLYAHTHEGLKLNLMRKNPEVCFQVDDMPDMANWRSVILWGIFEEITEPAQRVKAMQLLIDRNLPVIASQTVQLTPDYPFKPLDLSKVEGVVFKIKVTKKTGRFEHYVLPSTFAS